MMQMLAAFLRSLDPRLKLAMALVLGPCLWKVHILGVAAWLGGLLAAILPLVASQPLPEKMVRSLFLFVFFWGAIKAVLDSLGGIPMEHVALDAAQLCMRLAAMLLLGLVLALSSSARALGLATAWAVRPFVGRERAWHVALSLALMIHFLPVCLTTLNQVDDNFGRRFPGAGFRYRMRVVPQTVIRVLGQKTWSQTLAVACRRLDGPDAWEADFSWALRDWLCAFVFACAMALLLAV